MGPGEVDERSARPWPYSFAMVIVHSSDTSDWVSPWVARMSMFWFRSRNSERLFSVCCSKNADRLGRKLTTISLESSLVLRWVSVGRLAERLHSVGHVDSTEPVDLDHSWQLITSGENRLRSKLWRTSTFSVEESDAVLYPLGRVIVCSKTRSFCYWIERSFYFVGWDDYPTLHPFVSLTCLSFGMRAQSMICFSVLFERGDARLPNGPMRSMFPTPCEHHYLICPRTTPIECHSVTRKKSIIVPDERHSAWVLQSVSIGIREKRSSIEFYRLRSFCLLWRKMQIVHTSLTSCFLTTRSTRTKERKKESD